MIKFMRIQFSTTSNLVLTTIFLFKLIKKEEVKDMIMAEKNENKSLLQFH